MTSRVFVSDCEGPISKNDNAFELAEHYISDGARFFRTLSRYDDVLAYLEKRPGYSAGYTLKLVAPFLKAYGATNESIRSYSGGSITLIEDSDVALGQISRLLPTFMVSTSYEQYIEALCRILDFPSSNTYSTHLDLDRFEFDEGETSRLREIRIEINRLPQIEIPEEAEKVDDLPSDTMEAVGRLDIVFFSELPKLSAGKLLNDVRPIGSREKAEALEAIRRRTGASLTEVMYVGDSITDVEAFRSVRRSGGLAVSFNGNRYAVREADLAILSRNAMATAAVAEVYAKLGRKGAIGLAERWPDSLRGSVNEETFARISALPELPEIRRVTRQNLRQVAEASDKFRRMVRGRVVGSLG